MPRAYAFGGSVTHQHGNQWPRHVRLIGEQPFDCAAKPRERRNVGVLARKDLSGNIGQFARIKARNFARRAELQRAYEQCLSASTVVELVKPISILPALKQ